MLEKEKREPTLQEKFEAVLSSSSAGGDDERLLDLASSFSVQLSAAQIRILLALNFYSDGLVSQGMEDEAAAIRSFVREYLRLKKYHGSEFYVMRALDAISLRKVLQDRLVGAEIIKK